MVKPMNCDALLAEATEILSSGVPESAAPKVVRQCNTWLEAVEARRSSLEKLLEAYEGSTFSFHAPVLKGIYYARLEMACGTFKHYRALALDSSTN